MKEYSMTFREFNNQFATEEQCRKYLYDLRFSNGFVCPKCSNRKAWEIGGILFEYSDADGKRPL